MNRRRTHLNDVFNICPDDELQAGPSVTSSQSDVQSSSDSHNPLTATHIPNMRRIRSNSLDHQPNLSNLAGSGSKGNMRRWSQTLNNGSKLGTIRQRTIRHLPSRMHRAIALDGQIIKNDENDIEQLTQEIEQHEHLMEDHSALSEQLRIDTLRALPQSIQIKREIKAKLTKSVTNKSKFKNISQLKRLKYNIGLWTNRTKTSITNTINNIELWYDSMKKIEGHFGSGVSTYFKFLRWLFLLDILLLLISFGFIVIPQLIYNNLEVNNDPINIAQNPDVTFAAIDILTANGSLRNSILFYGSYANVTLQTSPQSAIYSIPKAYFMTMLCLYVLTFILVSVSMARSYRKSFIETSGGDIQNTYGHKIFCSWDFGISNEKSARLKHKGIYNELKEILNELNEIPKPNTRRYRLWTLSSQITAHLIIFGMLAGLGVGMWTLLTVINDQSATSFSVLYVPLTVNFTILILQSVFSWISFMEEYKSPRVTLHITLMRNYFLEVTIVGVLLVFWLTRQEATASCWETSIGQEIYRLIIIDFLIFGIGGIFYHVIRYLLFRYLWPQIGLPEFDISRGSLGLILNQTLLWVGLLFSPLLAVVIIIKMIFTFYIKKTILMYFCKPPSKLWRSAQTSTLFLVMTFLSLMGVVIVLGYIMTQVRVSEFCGPFRDKEKFMIDIFFDILALQQDHIALKIIMSVFRPGVVAGIILTLSGVAYYLRSKSKARIAMVNLLKDMLYMESKDKEFLLLNITKITHGKDWLFDEINLPERNIRTDQYAESSSTWNYRNESYYDNYNNNNNNNNNYNYNYNYNNNNNNNNNYYNNNNSNLHTNVIGDGSRSSNEHIRNHY